MSIFSKLREEYEAGQKSQQPTIDALNARIAELEAALSRVCDAFGIGEEVRQPVVLMTNIENARRRSDCLSRIEIILSVEEVCEDGDIDSVSLLNWGDEPDAYEARFRKVLEAHVKQAGAEARLTEIDTLEQWAETQGTSVISEAFRRQFLNLMARRREVLHEEARRLRGEGE